MWSFQISINNNTCVKDFIRMKEAVEFVITELENEEDGTVGQVFNKSTNSAIQYVTRKRAATHHTHNGFTFG